MKNWQIEIKPSAEKQYLKLDKKTRQRIKETLSDIERKEMPLFHPRVRALTGKLKGDYRIRIGDWRVLFSPNHDTKVLSIYAILPRGNAY